jgi:hypothetical protein
LKKLGELASYLENHEIVRSFFSAEGVAEVFTGKDFLKELETKKQEERNTFIKQYFKEQLKKCFGKEPNDEQIKEIANFVFENESFNKLLENVKEEEKQLKNFLKALPKVDLLKGLAKGKEFKGNIENIEKFIKEELESVKKQKALVENQLAKVETAIKEKQEKELESTAKGLADLEAKAKDESRSAEITPNRAVKLKIRPLGELSSTKLQFPPQFPSPSPSPSAKSPSLGLKTTVPPPSVALFDTTGPWRLPPLSSPGHPQVPSGITGSNLHRTGESSIIPEKKDSHPLALPTVRTTSVPSNLHSPNYKFSNPLYTSQSSSGHPQVPSGITGSNLHRTGGSSTTPGKTETKLLEKPRVIQTLQQIKGTSIPSSTPCSPSYGPFDSHPPHTKGPYSSFPSSGSPQKGRRRG